MLCCTKKFDLLSGSLSKRVLALTFDRQQHCFAICCATEVVAVPKGFYSNLLGQ